MISSDPHNRSHLFSLIFPFTCSCLTLFKFKKPPWRLLNTSKPPKNHLLEGFLAHPLPLFRSSEWHIPCDTSALPSQSAASSPWASLWWPPPRAPVALPRWPPATVSEVWGTFLLKKNMGSTGFIYFLLRWKKNNLNWSAVLFFGHLTYISWFLRFWAGLNGVSELILVNLNRIFPDSMEMHKGDSRIILVYKSRSNIISKLKKPGEFEIIPKRPFAKAENKKVTLSNTRVFNGLILKEDLAWRMTVGTSTSFCTGWVSTLGTVFSRYSTSCSELRAQSFGADYEVYWDLPLAL